MSGWGRNRGVELDSRFFQTPDILRSSYTLDFFIDIGSKNSQICASGWK